MWQVIKGIIGASTIILAVAGLLFILRGLAY